MAAQVEVARAKLIEMRNDPAPGLALVSIYLYLRQDSASRVIMLPEVEKDINCLLNLASLHGAISAIGEMLHGAKQRQVFWAAALDLELDQQEYKTDVVTIATLLASLESDQYSRVPILNIELALSQLKEKAIKQTEPCR